ncbi:MAG TPA: hypothetical protein VLL69_17790 [Streptosporangiaceae bacterium]|nr:hypothetical protein [Streptosporangiaceae bacterium]
MSLPGVAELLRPVGPGPASDSGRQASGREAHSQKITVYLSVDEFLDLERVRLTLRAHGIGVDRGRLVREAIAVLMMDLEAGIDASVIARRLGAAGRPGPAATAPAATAPAASSGVLANGTPSAPAAAVAKVAPADAILANGARADTTLAGGVLTDGALAGGVLTDGALAGGGLTDGALAGGVPGNGAPVTGALAYGVPAQGGPVAGALANGDLVAGPPAGAQ